MSILIIGGGIAGLSAAARLARHGPVTVIEAEDALGYHASGRSAAIFIPDYGNDVVKALNMASLPYMQEGGFLSPRGMMMLAKPGQDEAFVTEAAGFNLTEIAMDDARAMVPPLNLATCVRAAWRETVWDIDTDLLLQGFAREARAHGARIVTRARVTRIARDNGRWQVSAGGETHEADIVVNAAGAWADEVAAMAGVAPKGLQPYRRSMARIPAPGGHDTRGWPLLDGVGEGWYAKPDAGKLVVSPADEDPMPPQDAWADDMVLAEGLARFEEMMAEPVTRVEANWAGLRTFAPDRTLVVGRDPGTPDFIWLAGQGGYGFQTCPAVSQLAADIVLGRTPELDAALVTALDPARFA